MNRTGFIFGIIGGIVIMAILHFPLYAILVGTLVTLAAMAFIG